MRNAERSNSPGSKDGQTPHAKKGAMRELPLLLFKSTLEWTKDVDLKTPCVFDPVERKP